MGPSVIKLSIHHKTTYQYGESVRFGAHRLMLRPRESRDLRLISSDLLIAPVATVVWAHDVFGNATANAAFEEMSDKLIVESSVVVELSADPWPVFDIAASA